MKNLLSQLQGSDSILLMYVADEFPPEDRAEVDRRLAADEPLRLQLQQLSQTMDAVATAAAVPSSDRSVERAIRQTTAAMRQRQAELASRPVPAPEQARLLLPWWCYPVAAAAAVILAAAVFFANVEPTPATPQQRAQGPSVPAQDIVPWQAFSGLTIDPIAAHVVAEEMVDAFDDSEAMLADAGDRGLAKATREMESLNQSSHARLDAIEIVIVE